MKRVTIFFSLLLVVGCISAQHLDFMGYEMGINIDDFTKQMRQRFPLQKKVGGERYFIYNGTIYGHNVYFKADFTRKSRLVYRVTVTPKHIDQNALVDSLVVHYGEGEEMQGGYRWVQPGGFVFLYMPEGYDPTLIYLDAQAAAVLKQEDKK